MSGVNSHIRVPKCILKQFEDDKHFVYFWDLKNGWIQKSHAESINTKKGYYSLQAEAFLRDEIETPLGKAIQTVKNIDLIQPEFTMDNSTKEIFRRYVHALVARSQTMLEIMNKSSVFLQFMSLRDQHDLAAIMGIDEAQRARVFGDWEITFMMNRTNTPFVLPLCGTYSFSLNGDTMFSVPLTPYRAIIFMEHTAVKKYYIDQKMRLFQIVEPAQVIQFNAFALSSEQKDGNYGIASNEKRVLEMLQKNSVLFPE